MKPNSESLKPVEARYDWVAEGNCVPARVRGEQSEAKDQPQTKVNSIRPGIVTSQRSKHICGEPGVCGEVRGASLILSPDIPRNTGTEERYRVVGVRMVGRLHGLNQESSRLAERTRAVRVLIVAWKRVTTVERRGIERWTGLDESGLLTPERVPSLANHSGQGLGGETAWMPKPALAKTSPVPKAPARGNGRGQRVPLRVERPICQTVPALSLQSRAGSLTCGHPPIGEPDAGNLHVRFGGRGGANQCAIPTSIRLPGPMPT